MKPWLLGEAADGFYEVAIRKHPTADCWSWALEWNHNLRIVGFFGDMEAARQIVSTFSPIETQALPCEGGHSLQVRMEVPLPEHEDVLFYSDAFPT